MCLHSCVPYILGCQVGWYMFDTDALEAVYVSSMQAMTLAQKLVLSKCQLISTEIWTSWPGRSLRVDLDLETNLKAKYTAPTSQRSQHINQKQKLINQRLSTLTTKNMARRKRKRVAQASVFAEFFAGRVASL